jgi:hypothetical protein
MRGIALLLFGVLVLVVSPSLASTGSAAEPDIVFQTISLTHLRAGEIAPSSHPTSATRATSPALERRTSRRAPPACCPTA